jgi:hypothetical protein
VEKRLLTQIREIVIHCSDSDNPSHDNVNTIRAWHLERAFEDIGYHYVITKDGIIDIGRDLALVGAHVYTHNKDTIGICLTGRESFSDAQFKGAADLIDLLYVICENLIGTFVFPHNFYYQKKTCPNFDISEIAKYSLLPEFAFYKAKA